MPPKDSINGHHFYIITPPKEKGFIMYEPLEKAILKIVTITIEREEE